jgi:hypothetical protein
VLVVPAASTFIGTDVHIMAADISTTNALFKCFDLKNFFFIILPPF